MAIKRRYPALATVAALLAVVVASAAADGDESNPPGTEVQQIVVIEPEAKDALDVLDEQRDVGDALPQDVAEQIDEAADFGMNPDLSRLSIGNATHSVFVIPARDRVCASLTVGQGIDVACPLTDKISSGEAAPATVVLETGIAIYGIVPDGVESVSVQTGTSNSADLPVDDNAYYTVVPSGTRLRTVRYVGPSGPVEFPIYDPTLVLEGQ